MFNIYKVKYLNTFDKLFESSQCLNDLKDIALDISDDGFDTKVGARYLPPTGELKGSSPTEVNVFIKTNLPNGARREDDSSNFKEFYLCEISQCVQRMIDYMRGEGYYYDMYTKIGTLRSYLGWKDIPIGLPLDRNCLGGKKIGYIDIKFTKKYCPTDFELRPIKNINESKEIFDNITDYLQDIFDKYDIPRLTYFELDVLSHQEKEPNYKFWIVIPKTGNDEPDAIYIQNLNMVESRDILKDIKSIQDSLEKFIGKKLSIVPKTDRPSPGVENCWIIIRPWKDRQKWD